MRPPPSNVGVNARLTETHPGQLDAWLLYGAAALEAGDTTTAIVPGDGYFERLLTVLKDGAASAADRMRLHFAAATIFEQAGEIETAFEHYSAGNDLKDVVFDPAQYAVHIGQLIETFDKDVFAKVKSWGSRDERPVFIVGMPRSGTSLVEQIIASHHGVFGAGELETFNKFFGTLAEHCKSEADYPDCINDLSAETVAAMANEHLSTLSDLAPNAHQITDKMPTNFLHIGLIAALFPHARIIHCRRDPRGHLLLDLRSRFRRRSCVRLQSGEPWPLFPAIRTADGSLATHASQQHSRCPIRGVDCRPRNRDQTDAGILRS